jgi:hypothetical protein
MAGRHAPAAGQPMAPAVRPAQGVAPAVPGALRGAAIAGQAGRHPSGVAPRGASPPPGEQETEEEGNAVVDEYLRASPPWIVSAVVHMALIMLLMCIFLSVDGGEPALTVTIAPRADQFGEIDADDLVDLKVDTPTDDSVLTPQNLPEVLDPFAAPPNVEVALEGFLTSSDANAPQIGLALLGRSEGMKKALLSRYGGTEQTEAAVRLALQWLSRQQRQDGSWSLQGPYSDGAVRENEVAATAMAMLAFQGSGHTHQVGLYKTQMAKALAWLLKQQTAEGNFLSPTTHEHFYTHGQATIVLCELYGMTKDAALREPAAKAVEYCVKTQNPRGAWRYGLSRDGYSADVDTSVTGWIVMALQSARMAGLEVPQRTLALVHKYLDEAGNRAGTRYAYVPGADTDNPVMTAEALLCRQYLGWQQYDERLLDGVKYLLLDVNLPKWNKTDVNYYYWYYATQVMHHMEGEYWDRWNSVMRDVLVRNQTRSGKEAGSWDPAPDIQWGLHGGRLYSTCLATYVLEVYYRHLPIYAGTRALRP